MTTETAALTRYNSRYENALYMVATRGMNSKSANALIDDALAICGHPSYKRSARRWNKRAQKFLAQFK